MVLLVCVIITSWCCVEFVFILQWHVINVCSKRQQAILKPGDCLVVFLGVSGKLKQMVPSLLPLHQAPHLCHSLLRRNGSLPTPLRCSFHLQALCQGPTLTCPVSGSHLASWVGYERCLEELGHSFVLASSKRLCCPSLHS